MFYSPHSKDGERYYIQFVCQFITRGYSSPGRGYSRTRVPPWSGLGYPTVWDWVVVLPWARTELDWGTSPKLG